MPARTSCPAATQSPPISRRRQKIFAGGYSRATSHDTRLRLALEIMNLPYTMVTGFQGTGHLNQAMLKDEVNFTGSSLPGFQTQVIPQIIKEGIGVALFHHPVMATDGGPQGNPLLEKQGIITFYQFYREAFGKEPSGAKYEALFLMNDISTKMQRGMLIPTRLAAGSDHGVAQGVPALARTIPPSPGIQGDHRRGSRHRQSGRDRADLRAHPQGRARR